MSSLFKKNLWQFSRITNIEDSTFNKVLEKFYDYGISGLIRENLQNSLDGRLPGCDKPVIVTIKTGSIMNEFIPGLGEIKQRILCLHGHNNYAKETIAYMQDKMNQDEVSYISFEDSNTKGLTGAMNGQSDSKEDTWGIYAYNKGVHFEESDDEFEKSRGGSHGIGKIASNAASDLYMMYFANCDERGNKHLGGTVQLIEHRYNDELYRSTGYFTDVEEIGDTKTKFYPFENKFHEIFAKDKRGLKIIIPFFREQFNNEKEIIKSICDSFFIAIIKGKLEVNINDKRIDSSTIKNYICNEEYYFQEISEMKEDFTPLYYNTYINKKPALLTISDMKKEHKFKLYFDYNEFIPKGRVAIIRTIGMKIEDKKVIGNVNKPFNAVLIPNSIVEDAFLKSLENESHTELSFEHIKDQNLQKNAKRFINNISKEIAKILEYEIKKNNPTDGFINTKDILYTVENQFKKELAKAVSTVRLNKGKNEVTVIKISTDAPKKDETNSKDNKQKNSKKKTKRKVLKRVKKNEDQEYNEEKQIRYNAHPDMVERLVLGDKEIIKFDFSDTIEMKKVKVCDISLSIVDGMGVEYVNEFDLKDNYKFVIDKTTDRKCSIENNLIKNVVLKKGIAQIELGLNEKYNKALKFVYYVEV